MQRRFVILATPRTGSNMLVSLLNDHPEVTCFGELMRATPKWMLKQGYRGALRSLEDVDPRWRDDRTRFADPEGFVDEVIEKLAEAETVGFKLMLAQHPSYMQSLILDTRYKKIVLSRSNVLAAYSSDKIAKATGQGTARVGMEVKRATVSFDSEEFEQFLAQRRRQYMDVKALLRRHDQTFLEAEYLDLVTGRATSDILRFLGVDPSRAVQPETIKRNPSDLLKRFDNPAEVRRTLRELDAEHWTVEQPVAA